MRRTSGYTISLFLGILLSILQVKSQDTISFPLKIRVGLEVLGPAVYIADKDILVTEGFLSADLDEVKSVVFAAGYADYTYSQYNYVYTTNGIFARAGIDLNLMKPKKNSQGRYWGGLGLRYGISHFTYEIPSLQQENYWGTALTSVSKSTSWAHFLEATPGIRAEVLRNFSLGWSVNLRLLLYSGTGSDMKPIYLPGFGNADKRFNISMSYYMVWSIPFKKIRVIIKKEKPAETKDQETEVKGQ